VSREFACEHCGGAVHVTYAKLGDEVHCRHCGAQTHVSAAPSGAARIEPETQTINGPADIPPASLTALLASGALCPHCGQRPIAAARKPWFIQSFVFVTRYGTKVFIGCRECVRAKVQSNLLTSALVGWWGIPWGLGTPLVIVQNLMVLQQDEARDLEVLHELIGSGQQR